MCYFLNIITLVLGNFAVNTYIVHSDNSRECVIIDPGHGFSKINTVISENHLCPKAILLTHSHFDHTGSVEEVREHYGCPIYLSEEDVEMLGDPEKNLSQVFCDSPIAINDAEITLYDGEVFNIAGLTFEAIHTPGHVKGCMCYKCGTVLFTGDTLFDGCCGRCDLWSSNADEMRQSLEKLFSFKENLSVCPGHGNATTLDKQRTSYKYSI